MDFYKEKEKILSKKRIFLPYGVYYIFTGGMVVATRGPEAYYHTKKNNKPVIRFRLKAAFLIAAVVFIACFVIYMAEANISSKQQSEPGFSADSSAVLSDTTEAETMPHDENRKALINPVPASDPKSEAYFGKCMFVGDSISVGFSDYQFMSAKNVIAEIGMNIEKINTDPMKTAYGEVTALEALKAADPENVYIMLGSNGIAWLPTDTMIEYYSEFVDKVMTDMPEADIYILSIPPVTAERETAENEPILNSDIDNYNSELLKMANEKQIYYVDINTILKNNDGKLPSEQAQDDGMHFVKDTYSVVVDYILSHTAE